MRRVLPVLVTVLLVALGTSACGDGSSDATSPSNDSVSTPLVIDIAVTGDSITPNGERLDAAVGQPITLKVSSDAPGEIHVHSTPEQEYEYEAGDSTIEMDPIERPGVVEIESHTLDRQIVSLEVK